MLVLLKQSILRYTGVIVCIFVLYSYSTYFDQTFHALKSGPKISSRPIGQDDHTKRPDDYENDFFFLENLSQFIGNPFCLRLS